MSSIPEQKPNLPPPSSWPALAARIWDYGWPRFRRWMEKRKHENRIFIRLDDLSVYISEMDRGRFDFRLEVINISRRQLQLDYIELKFWKLGFHSLSDQTNMVRATGDIAKYSVGKACFSISLSSSDIRDTIRGIEAAQCTKLTPRAYFESNGNCIFNFQTRPIRVPFIFGHQCNSINIPLSIIEQSK
jgi:hypothetical protein